MRKLRVGVIGGGTQARVGHIPWWIKNPNSELIAVAEPSKDVADGLIKEFKIGNVYTNTERPDLEMLDKEDLDVVSVCTPPGLHCEHTVEAAKRGIHVLCEKPMALTVEDCDKMITACEKNHVKLQIGFMKRYNLGFQRIKEIIDMGELGTIGYVHLHWTLPPKMSRPPAPKGVERIPEQWMGGGFMADGPHYIDQFRWLIGEIKSICGEYRPASRGPSGFFGDVSIAVLRFENDSIGIIHRGAGYCDPNTGSLYEHGEVDGMDGSIRWKVPAFSSFELPEIHTMKGVMDCLVPIRPPIASDPYVNYQFYRQIAGFIDCINNDSQPLVNGKDGRVATEIVLAFFKSVDEGRTVKLPLEGSPNLPGIMKNLIEKTRK